MSAQRRVVATIGPASESEAVLAQILPNLGIARMNMSHGSHAEHEAKINSVRKLDPQVKILVDLQGPKIRVGKFPGGPVEFRKGDRTHIIYDPANYEQCDRMHLYVSVPEIINDVNAGDILLFNDGYLSARVEEKRASENRLYIEILNPGKLSDKKGINSSTASLSTNPLTEKDIKDLEFGARMNPDYIALSFVRSVEDVKDLRARMDKLGCKAKIIVKIERHEALKNLEAIIKEADCTMIARGDLAVEIEQMDLPHWQYEMIRLCKMHGKECIWATQVLESMANSPRPLRSELTDVHAAITHGATFTMLSAESATGLYPVETVSFMAAMWAKYYGKQA